MDNGGGSHILPRFSTTFIGRERETEDLARLVRANRFVGLVGPGGVGKTRLATVVAHLLSDECSDGTVAADLASSVTPDEVCAAIAGAIGMRDAHSATLSALIAALRDRNTLLLLDSCERLDPDCLLLLQDLLEASDKLAILATSRRALHVDGGLVMTLPTLPVPPTESEIREAGISAADIAPYAAVQLFVERARLVRREFAVTDDNARSVATLCRRLDGLPLAIELAASWVRVLSVDQIVERMHETLEFPRAGMGSIAPRHRTLSSLVAGTYVLCKPEERLLWSRMTVFHGTFDINAVEAVCGTPPLDRTDLLDTVAALVDQSVVVVDDIAGQSRYRLLRITRDYAADLLEDRDLFIERHRIHFVGIVEAFTARWPGPGQLRLLNQLQLDYPNILVAIDSGLHHPDTAPASIRMAADLWNLWFASGRLTEGRTVLRRVVASPIADAQSVGHVRALYVNSYLCVLQGELRSARKLHEVATATLGARDDPLNRAMSYQVEAMIQMGEENPTESAALLDQAIETYAELDDPRARVLYMDAIGVAVLLAALTNDSVRANELGQRGLTACDEYGDVLWRGYIDYALGVNTWMERRYDAARAAALTALTSSPDELLVTHCIELLAWCGAREKHYESGARLFANADRRWNHLGGYFSGFRAIAWHRDRCLDETKQALGEELFNRAYSEGASLGLASLVDEAQALAAPESLPSRGIEERSQLTNRELEVAHLLAEGLSNREIAEALTISPRTAESHVDHILTKLNLPNRTQVATWMLAQGK